MGNNNLTFSHYPTESIDRSRDEAWLRLSENDRADLERLENDENGRSNWFAHRALAYMRENPLPVLQGMFRKLDAAFSWRLNPLREPAVQGAYSIAYVPVAILGLIGMFLTRRQPEVILIGLLFIAFICLTAAFWAHTSHRTYLDVYWIVFAASIVERLRTPLRQSQPRKNILTMSDPQWQANRAHECWQLRREIVLTTREPPPKGWRADARIGRHSRSSKVLQDFGLSRPTANGDERS
jgi:hypothetical protein